MATILNIVCRSLPIRVLEWRKMCVSVMRTCSFYETYGVHDWMAVWLYVFQRVFCQWRILVHVHSEHPKVCRHRRAAGAARIHVVTVTIPLSGEPASTLTDSDGDQSLAQYRRGGEAAQPCASERPRQCYDRAARSRTCPSMGTVPRVR